MSSPPAVSRHLYQHADVASLKPAFAHLAQTVPGDADKAWKIYPAPPPPHWHWRSKNKGEVTEDGENHELDKDEIFDKDECEIPGEAQGSSEPQRDFTLGDDGVYSVFEAKGELRL